MSANNTPLPVSAEDLEKLSLIHAFMRQANSLFESLPLELRDRILDVHNEIATLNHCLRWGEQNSGEILEMAEAACAQSAKPKSRGPR